MPRIGRHAFLGNLSTDLPLAAGVSRQVSGSRNMSDVSGQVNEWEPRLAAPLIERAEQRRGFVRACIRTSPVFAGLPPSAESELAARAVERFFASRQTIFREDDSVRFVDVIATGSVKITQLTAGGSEVILRVERVGYPIDGMGDRSDIVHTTTAYAARDCCILSWSAAEFAGFTDRYPVIHRNAMLVVMHRLKMLQECFCDVSTARAPQRLARVLLRLVEHSPALQSDTLGLSREELAQMTGTSPFTISRLLSEWAQRQIVYVDRNGVIVENLASLRALSQCDEPTDNPIPIERPA